MLFNPPTILFGLLLCTWMWGIFFWLIQHSPVSGCSAASCNFGVFSGEYEHVSFYSAFLFTLQNNTLEGISSRITDAREWISDMEDRMVKIIAIKQNIEKM